MLKGIAKWYARLSYLFTLEVEAAKGEINAATAKRNADEKRKLVEQLNAEPDAIDASIKQVEAEEEARKSAPEYERLSAQEKYEDERAAKKEKDAALQIAAEKRNLAKQESQNVSDAEQTAQSLRGMAQNSRAFAG